MEAWYASWVEGSWCLGNDVQMRGCSGGSNLEAWLKLGLAPRSARTSTNL